jgi:hypothetical protein
MRIAVLRGMLLFLASSNGFAQSEPMPAANRIYPYANRGPGPFSNAFGLTDSQLKQLEQRHKDLADVLDDAQKLRLASLKKTVQEAYEAAALGLLNTDWQFSGVCNNYRAATAALALDKLQLAQLHSIRHAADAAGRQLSAKQAEFDRLLQADSQDVVSVGQLAIDIARLRKQTPNSSSVLNQALAILNSDQHAKLQEIRQAVQATKEAVQLGLMDMPSQWQGGECLCP